MGDREGSVGRRELGGSEARPSGEHEESEARPSGGREGSVARTPGELGGSDVGSSPD